MKLLLDTHIWLWSLLQPDRLGRRTAAALKNSAVEKLISPVSIWEFQVLAEKGRLDLLGAEPRAWISQALRDFPVKEATLTNEVVLAIPEIRLAHRNPADAFLAATAKVFDLTLVTADSRLFFLKGISVLRNR